MYELSTCHHVGSKRLRKMSHEVFNDSSIVPNLRKNNRALLGFRSLFDGAYLFPDLLIGRQGLFECSTLQTLSLNGAHDRLRMASEHRPVAFRCPAGVLMIFHGAADG